jgi:hypothetical protein
MSTLPTTSAIIQHCSGWEPRLLVHPLWSWMADYETAFDWGAMKSGLHTPWHTDDFSFTKATGEVIAGGIAAWAAVVEMYAPFSAHFHEPFFFVIWETETGYELFGCAKMFVNLHAPGEQTKADLQGRKWDVEAPGAFHFVYVKDPEGPKGMKLKSEKLFADGLPMVGEMVKRGMVTPEQVLAKAS